jgi:hypothetical protein
MTKSNETSPSVDGMENLLADLKADGESINVIGRLVDALFGDMLEPFPAADQSSKGI